MSSTSSVILGIDPGTNFLGYSVIRYEGAVIQILETGVLTMTHLEDASEKLKRIYDRVSTLISRYNPQSMAIEAPFFGKNIQSMLKLGRAQGVAIAASLAADVPFTEYAPRRIKQAITGKGGATKDQVAAMLEQILRQPVRTLMSEDASDSLAVAVCHYYQITKRVSGTDGSVSGWAAFIKKNPDKIVG